uniref:C2H2-type domain-containing protein n=1 Tax=Timema cristinae TaxID=61476 RepID=A0A7R9DAD0_TIMCR|nr:unnamed protein product [Timema cristinae]
MGGLTGKESQRKDTLPVTMSGGLTGKESQRKDTLPVTMSGGLTGKESQRKDTLPVTMSGGLTGKESQRKDTSSGTMSGGLTGREKLNKAFENNHVGRNTRKAAAKPKEVDIDILAQYNQFSPLKNVGKRQPKQKNNVQPNNLEPISSMGRPKPPDMFSYIRFSLKKKFSCKICNIKIDSYMDVLNHMMSEAHQRSVAIKGDTLLEKIDRKDQRHKELSLKYVFKKLSEEDKKYIIMTPDGKLTCEPCAKSFYTPEVTHDHLASKLHAQFKKRAEFTKLCKDNFILQVEVSHWQCSVCKSLSDVTLKSIDSVFHHVKSDRHETVMKQWQEQNIDVPLTNVPLSEAGEQMSGCSHGEYKQEQAFNLTIFSTNVPKETETSAKLMDESGSTVVSNESNCSEAALKSFDKTEIGVWNMCNGAKDIDAKTPQKLSGKSKSLIEASKLANRTVHKNVMITKSHTDVNVPSVVLINALDNARFLESNTDVNVDNTPWVSATNDNIDFTTSEANISDETTAPKSNNTIAIAKEDISFQAMSVYVPIESRQSVIPTIIDGGQSESSQIPSLQSQMYSAKVCDLQQFAGQKHQSSPNTRSKDRETSENVATQLTGSKDSEISEHVALQLTLSSSHKKNKRKLIRRNFRNLHNSFFKNASDLLLSSKSCLNPCSEAYSKCHLCQEIIPLDLDAYISHVNIDKHKTRLQAHRQTQLLINQHDEILKALPGCGDSNKLHLELCLETRITRCGLCGTCIPLDYNDYHSHVTGPKHIELLQHVKNQSLDSEGGAFRNNKQSPRLALLSALASRKSSEHFLCEQEDNSSDSDEEYKESAGKNISSKRENGKLKRSPKTNKQAISVLSSKSRTQRVTTRKTSCHNSFFKNASDLLLSSKSCLNPCSEAYSKCHLCQEIIPLDLDAYISHVNIDKHKTRLQAHRQTQLLINQHDEILKALPGCGDSNKLHLELCLETRITRCGLCGTCIPLDYNDYHSHVTGPKHIELLQHVKNQSLDSEGGAFRNNKQSPRLALLSALASRKSSEHFLCEQEDNSSDSDEEYKESAGKNISSKRENGKLKRSPKTNKQAISVLSSKSRTQRVDSLQSNNSKIQVEEKLSSKDTFLAQDGGKYLLKGYDSQDKLIQNGGKSSNDDVRPFNLPTEKEALSKDGSPIKLVQKPTPDRTLTAKMSAKRKINETNSEALEVLLCRIFPPDLDITVHPDVHVMLKSRETLLDLCSQLSLLAISTSHPDVEQNILHLLENTLKPAFGKVHATLFGSRASGLTLPGSDLDIFIDLESSNSTFHESRSTQQFIVRMSANVLQQHPDYEKVCDILWARTPIVKLLHAPTQLNCDLTFKNGLGVENTKLLRYRDEGGRIIAPEVTTFVCDRLYTEYDERVKQLVLVVRLWSKLHMLTASNKFTNYALTVMTLFYLMTCRIIPPVEFLHWKYTGPKKFISGQTNHHRLGDHSACFLRLRKLGRRRATFWPRVPGFINRVGSPRVCDSLVVFLSCDAPQSVCDSLVVFLWCVALQSVCDSLVVFLLCDVLQSVCDSLVVFLSCDVPQSVCDSLVVFLSCDAPQSVCILTSCVLVV